MREEQLEREMQECTFKPKLSELSNTAMPHYRFDNCDGLMQQIDAEREFREQRLENQRRQIQYERECAETVPEKQIRHGSISKKLYEKVQVTGMDIVNRKSQLIKQQKEEYESRVQQIFGLKEGRERVPTVVKPFNLTQKSDTKMAQSQQGQTRISGDLDPGKIVDAIMRVEV